MRGAVQAIPQDLRLLFGRRRIIDSERSCCSFLRFQLTAEPATGPVTFDETGPPGTREVLRVL
jgi:hypothetical protein